MKRIFFLIFCLIFTVLLCIKRPKLQTDITVPLFSETVKVREILDSNYFRINPDSSIDLFYQAKIDTFRVNDSLKIFELNDTTLLTLNDFVINNLVHSQLNLTIGEITGFNLPETTLPVPPFETTLVGQEFPLTGIEQMAIAEVILVLEVSNYTQIGLDSIGLNLNQFGNFSFGSIQPGQTVERKERVQNINLTDSIIMADITIGSPGSPTPVRISGDDSLIVKLSLDSLRIYSGVFRVPVNGMHAVKTGSCSILSNYQIHIDSVTFLAGTLDLSLQNELPCPIQTFIHINEFGFDSIVDIPAYTINNFSLDFSGRTYTNSNPVSTILTCSTEVIVEPSSQPIRFEIPEFLSLIYTFKNPKIDKFTGTIYDTIRSQIKPKTINFNFPPGLSHINIENAELEAEIVSGLDFPILFYLKLEANNESGEQRIVDTLLAIEPGTPSQPRTTTLLMNVTELINIVPRDILITGYRGVTGSGVAENESFITGAYSFLSPLRLALQSSTINLKPQEVNIEEKYRNDIDRYLVSGSITAHYINHFPFSLDGVLKLESANTDTIAISFRVPQPEINDQTGLVKSPTDTLITIYLNSDQINIFKQKPFFASATLFLPTTDTVTVTARDYFSVDYSYSKLKLNLLK